MDPDEVEFLAEKQTLQIVPNFSCQAIHFVSGDVGPFRGGLPLNVPLWLAINLKQQQKCVIIAPDWMSLDNLEDLLNAEKNSKNFIRMPSEHYMIEAKLILGCAGDDILKSDEIRTIVKDIWDVRMSKIRTSMDALIKDGAFYAALDNLTMMEINAARPVLPHALEQLLRIKHINMAANSDRRITHIRDVFTNTTNNGVLSDRNEIDANFDDKNYPDNNRNKKYKTLERHLSMKKTIRKKMMRDLREIGDADEENTTTTTGPNGILEKLKTDQPPSANIDKPSLWKRLTKSWTGNTSKS